MTINRVICAAFVALLLPDAAHARSLSEVLVDLGGAGESVARSLADGQAESGSTPNYSSGLEGDEQEFSGYFIPATADTKLGIFSDDGCDVYIGSSPTDTSDDSFRVLNNFGQGQHLPNLDASFHPLSPVWTPGEQYHIRILYKNTIHPGSWDVDGLTVFAFDGGGAVPVQIDLPDGKYVGAGRDTAPIRVDAVLGGGVSAPSFLWSISEGPGDGYLLPDDVQHSELYGTLDGEVTIGLQVSTDSGSSTETDQAVVIEINDLDDSVPLQFMDIFELAEDQELVLPYQDLSTGDLRRVEVAPPEDPSDPFLWETDFSASVDHEEGDVVFTPTRPGPYLLRITRESNGQTSEEFAMVRHDVVIDNDGEDGKESRWKEEPVPTADLVLIPVRDDRKHARSHYDNEKDASTVDEAIAHINAYSAANDGEPFTVIIIDHGTSGRQNVGDTPHDDKLESGKFLTASTKISHVTSRQKFTTACKDRKVSHCQFNGCKVAEGEKGCNFLKKYSEEGEMVSLGWTLSVLWTEEGFYKQKGAELLSNEDCDAE